MKLQLKIQLPPRNDQAPLPLSSSVWQLYSRTKM